MLLLSPVSNVNKNIGDMSLKTRSVRNKNSLNALDLVPIVEQQSK